ncbi:DAK2 domain-containing protein [Nocardia sp. NPDC051030]|uniref:DAK2 domain-containing protein n=1 Tax=Nocardia sp. NPDC051030 TaxID=3155162 RepID=UPI00343C46D4
MPAERDALDGTALLRWGHLTLAALDRHRDEINALNVFPVPDSDTGTNLLATMRAAIQAAQVEAARPPADRPATAETLPVQAADPATSRQPAGGTGADRDVATSDRAASAAGERDLAEADSVEMGGRPSSPRRNTSVHAADSAITRAAEAQLAGAGLSARTIAGAMARAATVGARGNSGIILSQVLRGVAEAVWDGPLTEESLREALRRAAQLVREALSSPVEGTMLTVLDRAAERAADCPERSLSAVALAAADGAAKALGETPAQLGVLREAGVVDAGARGLLVLLDELVVVTGGEALTRPPYVRGAPGASERLRPAGVARGGSGLSAALGAAAAGADSHAGDVSAFSPQYEVMFLLSGADDPRVGELRDRLGELGDSVVVVGNGEGMWSAHVHCADAGAAVEAGIAAGALSGIRIETLAVSAHAQDGPVDRGILAVASGAGAVRLFEDSGAAVLEGEVTAESLLSGIQRMPQREVLVLPNGALPAHELVAVSVAARDGHREVLMLPSGSMVQGLAALSMHDEGRIAVDDAFAMSEAAAGTRWGALRVAPERALTIVGMCEAGDGLGLVGHDVVVIDSDVRAAGRTLLDRMLGLGGELVTMLIGADAPEGLSTELTEHIAAAFPGVEVVTYPGGQARDLVQIGVE